MTINLSNQPLVSVLMPVYNYGKFVAETVESIWNQTYDHLEIVAVDDGSTDDSLEILHDLASSSRFPMKVLSSNHLGVSGAMQMALANADGEFGAVVHADDIHLPMKIQKQIEALQRNPQASLCHCEYRCVDDRGVDMGYGSRDSDIPPASGAALKNILKLKSDVRSVSMFYRLSSLRARGGYDPSLPYEDWQAILRLAAEGEVVHLNEDLVLRRIHHHNRHINVTKFPQFNLDQIAPKVLLEVCPPGMDQRKLFVRHIGTIIASSAGSGNVGKSLKAAIYSVREYGFRYVHLVGFSLLRGLVSLIWLRAVSRMLPNKIVLKVKGFRRKRSRCKR